MNLAPSRFAIGVDGVVPEGDFGNLVRAIDVPDAMRFLSGRESIL